MKILLVSYYPLPYTGGVWTFVSSLQQSLKESGHTVHILSQTPDLNKYRIIGQKPEIDIAVLSPYIEEKLLTELPSLPMKSWIYNTELFRYSLELSAAYYNLQQYDLIHALDVTAANAINRVKPSHIPLVTSALGNLSRDIFFTLKTMHPHKTDEQIEATFEYQYHQVIEKLGYQASDFIHSPTEWMSRNIADNFSIPSDKIVTFPYGISNQQFLGDAMEKPLIGPKQSKKIILYMGRLVYLKGIHHLLDALALLKEGRQDWECWILGEGEIKGELEKQCTNLDLKDKVRFLGTSNNVLHFLREADIFVHPSIHDTQPYSVMEAQLAGLPVLISNTAGLPEMIEVGRSGLVSSVGNIYELYEQLKYLLANDLLRNQLASCTKEWAQDKWDLNKMVTNFLSLYEQAEKLNTENQEK
ncbi:Glycosyl transferase group 1 (plasmid) [Priestia megaterium WSH-002]|uniref:Glycosyl transferase group 1 n=1 Tax=Priestia megaterium (strain WSH-002) TaxID=1006007 RepID=A0A8D3X4A6_PRIMW|nr:glycosyltransferase family 4 protein [Priestia megaterium]AEN92113.1 Glycosyl transferase group 1 [Priestia megaterium WSH-002]